MEGKAVGRARESIEVDEGSWAGWKEPLCLQYLSDPRKRNNNGTHVNSSKIRKQSFLFSTLHRAWVTP